MDFNLASWWSGLSLTLQIYWGIAIPFSILFIAQMVMTFVGGDADGMDVADSDVSGDHGIGFLFFSLKNFIAFFTLFSWTGIACVDSGFELPVTLMISVVAGLAMMIVMASLFYYFSKLASSGTFLLKNAIGKTGEVYLPIRAQRAAVGKVQLMVQGSFRELDAITDEQDDIPTGSLILVVDVVNDSILLVSKSKPHH